MDQPSLIWASTLSPSVTATSRMLSPKRATLRLRPSAKADAVRIQPDSLSRTAGASQCPTTTLRGRRKRAPMKPCSRSPWADWLRFMKSISMESHGMSRLNWVCRWHSGLASWVRPAIHIFDGLKVCIHVTMPAQFGLELASRTRARMASDPFTTGFQMSLQGSLGSRASTMAFECSSTFLSVSAPYRSWLPVTK